ncbi:CLIP domain-containing serine protease HP8-like [Microplitis mediator]|uniref:CLIP domain-containing serine protease HP8-like n=1 Tax=Microplitis mediator TaxID=375433 RepID=UPI002554EDF0|nr:CLIP domain-containing serine protease HP8-like [Microplitis mediator]
MDYSQIYFFIYHIIYFILFCKSADITKHPSWMLLEHNKCGISNTDRIIGGKNASMGMYPWIARIGYSSDLTGSDISYRCGGTLINKLYVVTAAHCVSNLPGSFKVTGIRLGEHNSETNPDCENGYCADPVQDFKPIQMLVHKRYNTPHFKNDIALIRLDRPVVYNGFVMPICMPAGDLLKKNLTGGIAETAGWGIFDIDHPKSSIVLQTIKLPILETYMCVRSFKNQAQIDDMQLCVGGTVGKDSCTGDSGGPLMKVEALNDIPKYYLIGIVSFGAKHCGQTAMPAVYTRITRYLFWILENISP